MEKYLTPIQYEQYLHDTAHQAAMGNTSPSVAQVFALTGLFIVIVLICALLAAMYDKHEDREELADDVREAQDAAKERVLAKRKQVKTADANDKSWAKEFGHTR